MSEVMQNPDTQTQETQDTISELLGERDHPKAEAAADGAQSSVEEKDAPKPVSTEPEATPEVTTEVEDEGQTKTVANKSPVANRNEPEEGKDEPSQLDLLRKKLEKTEKVLADNQRYGRTNAQKVKAALKVAQQLAEDGILDESEARGLLDALQTEGEDHSVYPSPSSPAHLFAPIFRVANKELENIRKYTDDDRLQDKVEAFDWFLSTSSDEEREQALEDLTELLDNPVKLAKRMLSIGQDVYDGSYRAIREAGGVKNCLAQKEQVIEKLQKNIDKLEKKLLQYEDFDKPSWRLDEMMEDHSSAPAPDTISALFDERDRQWRPRRASGTKSP